MIFVTGGTGYLGTQLLCTLLQGNCRIIAMKRSSSDIDSFESFYLAQHSDSAHLLNNLEWVEGETDDINFLTDILQEGAEVYHCAASVGFSSSKNDNPFASNISGTSNLVDACLEKKVRKLCHVSSIGALGEARPGSMIDEESPWLDGSKHSKYAESKYLAELEVWRGIAEGLQAVIVNPSVISGPGIAGNSFESMVKLVGGGLTYYPRGSNAWVDVRDVATLMLKLMKEELDNNRYIVSSENLSYRDVFCWIAEELGVPAPSKKATPALMKLAGVGEQITNSFTGKANKLNQDIIRISSAYSSYCAKKIIRSTFYNFIPIRESVTDACKQYKKSFVPR